MPVTFLGSCRILRARPGTGWEDDREGRSRSRRDRARRNAGGLTALGPSRVLPILTRLGVTMAHR